MDKPSVIWCKGIEGCTAPTGSSPHAIPDMATGNSIKLLWRTLSSRDHLSLHATNPFLSDDYSYGFVKLLVVSAFRQVFTWGLCAVKYYGGLKGKHLFKFTIRDERGDEIRRQIARESVYLEHCARRQT
ncbi:hypothetical protein CBL_07116 [Carabus blaptoides fortunei]